MESALQDELCVIFRDRCTWFASFLEQIESWLWLYDSELKNVVLYTPLFSRFWPGAVIREWLISRFCWCCHYYK